MGPDDEGIFEIANVTEWLANECQVRKYQLVVIARTEQIDQVS